MNPQSRASMLAAYRSVATHGGVAAADPHQLILMLLEGALERLATARGCIERGAFAEKTQHVSRALVIVGELRASLDPAQGPLADRLDALYDYIARQLLRAHVEHDTRLLDSLSGLLGEIRAAWVAIPPQARARAQASR
jgi:flagellar protein FliS